MSENARKTLESMGQAIEYMKNLYGEMTNLENTVKQIRQENEELRQQIKVLNNNLMQIEQARQNESFMNKQKIEEYEMDIACLDAEKRALIEEVKIVKDGVYDLYNTQTNDRVYLSEQNRWKYGRPEAIEESQQLEVINLRKQGMSLRRIGDYFGVSYSTIARILKKHGYNQDNLSD